MKIIEIRGFDLSFLLKEPLGNALTFFRKREALLVQVVTDAGVSGWGEAGNSPHAAGTFIRTRLAGLVLGKSPADFGRHYQAMTSVLGYDRRGAGMMAISALDMALHDLAARMYGISVASLLGGAVRDRLFAYASGPFFRERTDPYREFEREADGYLKRNFRAIKPRGGFSPRADGVMARQLRRLAGPEVALMVDINQGYTARAAIQSAQHMEDAELLWIEEPVQPEDIPGYQTVARAVPVAIAGGEALGNARAFRDFLAAGTFSVLQPDLAVCGGYSGFREIAALARAYDLPVMPHVFGTTVNFHASMQMAAVIEPRRGGGPAPYPFMEYDAMANPLLDLCPPPALDSNGLLAVPEGPGTGLDLAPERLAPWTVGHWTEKL
ncbi:mandelate racemase/muconate lactonizing enzyme family protein [Bradyrhizobium sp. LHD-71]|uniref:mandelate racemase/muconate lactonizing enzyme family protein n=1 Tax=Bradyrhizobium sp. LHD-71 TaxID=3072141 RepID=UPI00280EB847|nr:mandelate racemase/muconate lactonizing enzyme family protein [Bradyrhizobium sp. LHD-71]MDQ8730980.1 mandelate racemase/muconate lactonizing enzyme family protein [Bradyrhizobium sp. LHD-71]